MHRRDALRAMVASLAGAIALPFLPKSDALPPFADPTALEGARYFDMQQAGQYDPHKFDAFVRENLEAMRRLGLRSNGAVNYLDGGF